MKKLFDNVIFRLKFEKGNMRLLQNDLLGYGFNLFSPIRVVLNFERETSVCGTRYAAGKEIMDCVRYMYVK